MKKFVLVSSILMAAVILIGINGCKKETKDFLLSAFILLLPLIS